MHQIDLQYESIPVLQIPLRAGPAQHETKRSEIEEAERSCYVTG